jgi:hypothetical protein
MAVTSNWVVQDWDKHLGDVKMASTLLDRLMHRCTMLAFEGKSYRLKLADAGLAFQLDASKSGCLCLGILGGHGGWRLT